MNATIRGSVAMAAALLATAPAMAQERAAARSETAAFVVTIGNDTLAVERFTRMRDSISGEVVSRSPSTVIRTYAGVLNTDGTVRRLEVTSRTSAAPQRPTTSTLQFTPDSVFTHVQRGDSVFDYRTAAPRAFPVMAYSHVFYEQAMMYARGLRADSVQLSGVPTASRGVAPLGVRTVGADSMLLAAPAGPQRVATDARGRLLGLNGGRSTQKFIVTRVADIDVDAFAAEFARRDAAHQGLGALSPRDSAVANFGGARLSVDYGRPFKRGRQIFGDVVPWGEVWRTGANAATGFTTTRDLEIGGRPVPAGSYTLWSLPTQQGWKLIINRQTGQWGTEYDPAQDLVRIDMQTRKLDDPVEEFTISLEPGGAGGVLRLEWDDVEAFVPVVVR